jgi:hypothetical protein
MPMDQTLIVEQMRAMEKMLIFFGFEKEQHSYCKQ